MSQSQKPILVMTHPSDIAPTVCVVTGSPRWCQSEAQLPSVLMTILLYYNYLVCQYSYDIFLKRIAPKITNKINSTCVIVSNLCLKTSARMEILLINTCSSLVRYTHNPIKTVESAINTTVL